MAVQIRTWQIVEGRPQPVDSSLTAAGRLEQVDLEAWIAADPDLIAPGLAIIGRQVTTPSGPLDLLAIDRDGNTVICELKRAQLPREALAQAIDYASAVAEWEPEQLDMVCRQHTSKSLFDVLAERFPSVDVESLPINSVQRIMLVGFEIGPALERMLEWLARSHVPANAVVLAYARSTSGDELISRTAILSEEAEELRARNRRLLTPASDEPGQYDKEELQKRLVAYLLSKTWSAYRIAKVVLPVLLESEVVLRETLRQELINRGDANDLREAGLFLALVSTQFSRPSNDFLRQIVVYERQNGYQKSTYALRPEYRDLVQRVLDAVGNLSEPSSAGLAQP